MNLTLRQIVNNHPLLRWVNRSTAGQKFQHSSFARNLEASLHLLGENVSNSVADGGGVIEGIMDPLFDTGWSGREIAYYKHCFQASRPDLDGTIDPRHYGRALIEQMNGCLHEDTIARWKPRKFAMYTPQPKEKAA